MLPCDAPARRFAVSLARPGGNTTGITSVGADIAPKWIEFLVEARNPDEYSEPLANAGRSSQGVVVLSGPEFTRNRFRIVELTYRYRLPSIYQFSEFVSIGGTLSYGPDITDLSYRAVAYMDKILKGANPAELPIEQPRKLFLVINRKAANALGLTVPPGLILQADQVIG